MLVLGIDPGSNITGYGLVVRQDNRLIHIDNGGIRPKAGLSLTERLHYIYTELKNIIAKHRPDAVAVEKIFVAKSAASSLILGHARGAALIAAAELKIGVAEYNPTEIKLALTGVGRATKDQIQKMVKVILSLPEVAMEDASDALAAAICHCNVASFKNKVSLSSKK